MKKLISFSAFAFIVLMMIAAHAAQAQTAGRVAIAPYPSVYAGMGAYPRPYRGYRCVRRVPYPMAIGYYPGPRLYRRPGIRVRVW